MSCVTTSCPYITQMLSLFYCGGRRHIWGATRFPMLHFCCLFLTPKNRLCQEMSHSLSIRDLDIVPKRKYNALLLCSIMAETHVAV